MTIPVYSIQRAMFSDDLRVVRLPSSYRVTSVALDNDNSHHRYDHYAYVDVGRWGGDARHFGVIYGDQSESYIVVCQFVPEPAGGARDGFSPVTQLPGQTGGASTVARKVMGFINHCRGEILHAARFSVVDTRGKLYLILGDLHLPLVSHLNRPTRAPFPEITCRVDTNYMEGLHSEEDFVSRLVNAGIVVVSPGTDQMMLDSPVRWYERYVESDIFTDPSSNRAATSLRDFLNLAARWEGGDTSVHFVQMGDMYELWVGVKCLFSRTDSSDRRVPIRTPCDMQGNCYLRNPSSLSRSRCNPIPGSYTDVIREWVDKIHETTRVDDTSFAEWLQRERFPDQTWLYGNHDNYLRNLSGQLGLESRSLVLHESDSQILFEHGHEADEYNRDGEVSGHAITQGAAFLWSQRWLERIAPDRRPDFIRYAAEKLLRRDPPLKVFVMAHTHIPFMASLVLNFDAS